MKLTKKQLTLSISSIAILVVSLVIMLLDIFVPLNIWVHPVLTFLFCLFVGFGVTCFTIGFIEKSSWYFFLSSVLLGLAFVYAFACSLPEYWWISLIIAGVVWAIFAVLSFMSAGSVTESVALNKSEDYKNYEQRKAEREQAEKSAEPEKLPEIKSFKNDK